MLLCCRRDLQGRLPEALIPGASERGGLAVTASPTYGAFPQAFQGQTLAVGPLRGEPGLGGRLHSTPPMTCLDSGPKEDGISDL